MRAALYNSVEGFFWTFFVVFWGGFFCGVYRHQIWMFLKPIFAAMGA